MQADNQALVLYTNPMSRGRIVRWMLEETGCPYEAVIHAYGQTRTPDYLAINPMGKVPAIEHRGHVVTETAAICTYLADAFPAAGLAPALDDPLRADYLRWLFFAAGPIEAATTARALQMEPPVEKAGYVGYGDYATVMDVLEQVVSRASPWLLGERFTAADVYLGSQVMFGLRFRTIEPRPAFVAYAKALAERPAFLRASAADDALLPPASPPA